MSGILPPLSHIIMVYKGTNSPLPFTHLPSLLIEMLNFLPEAAIPAGI
jgi:hypothetical protein